MQPRVRRARNDDARAIATVQVASWRDAYDGILPAIVLRSLSVRDTASSWRNRLHALVPGEEVWVVEVDRVVVGFAAAGPATAPRDLVGFAAEVSYLYVHPSCVGRGIGGLLLADVLARLERQGYLWVMVAVLEENRRARGFYEHLGLRFDGARWIDRRFDAPVVRHAKPLNAVVDYASLSRSRA